MSSSLGRNPQRSLLVGNAQDHTHQLRGGRHEWSEEDPVSQLTVDSALQTQGTNYMFHHSQSRQAHSAAREPNYLQNDGHKNSMDFEEHEGRDGVPLGQPSGSSSFSSHHSSSKGSTIISMASKHRQQGRQADENRHPPALSRKMPQNASQRQDRQSHAYGSAASIANSSLTSARRPTDGSSSTIKRTRFAADAQDKQQQERCGSARSIASSVSGSSSLSTSSSGHHHGQHRGCSQSLRSFMKTPTKLQSSLLPPSRRSLSPAILGGSRPGSASGSKGKSDGGSRGGGSSRHTNSTRSLIESGKRKTPSPVFVGGIGSGNRGSTLGRGGGRRPELRYPELPVQNERRQHDDKDAGKNCRKNEEDPARSPSMTKENDGDGHHGNGRHHRRTTQIASNRQSDEPPPQESLKEKKKAFLSELDDILKEKKAQFEGSLLLDVDAKMAAKNLELEQKCDTVVGTKVFLAKADLEKAVADVTSKCTASLKKITGGMKQTAASDLKAMEVSFASTMEDKKADLLSDIETKKETSLHSMEEQCASHLSKMKTVANGWMEKIQAAGSNVMEDLATKVHSTITTLVKDFAKVPKEEHKTGMNQEDYKASATAAETGTFAPHISRHSSTIEANEPKPTQLTTSPMTSSSPKVNSASLKSCGSGAGSGASGMAKKRCTKRDTSKSEQSLSQTTTNKKRGSSNEMTSLPAFLGGDGAGIGGFGSSKPEKRRVSASPPENNSTSSSATMSVPKRLKMTVAKEVPKPVNVAAATSENVKEQVAVPGRRKRKKEGRDTSARKVPKTTSTTVSRSPRSIPTAVLVDSNQHSTMSPLASDGWTKKKNKASYLTVLATVKKGRVKTKIQGRRKKSNSRQLSQSLDFDDDDEYAFPERSD